MLLWTWNVGSHTIMYVHMLVCVCISCTCFLRVHMICAGQPAETDFGNTRTQQDTKKKVCVFAGKQMWVHSACFKHGGTGGFEILGEAEVVPREVPKWCQDGPWLATCACAPKPETWGVPLHGYLHICEGRLSDPPVLYHHRSRASCICHVGTPPESPAGLLAVASGFVVCVLCGHTAPPWGDGPGEMRTGRVRVCGCGCAWRVGACGCIGAGCSHSVCARARACVWCGSSSLP